jgi:hypothetical protein
MKEKGKRKKAKIKLPSIEIDKPAGKRKIHFLYFIRRTGFAGMEYLFN